MELAEAHEVTPAQQHGRHTGAFDAEGGVELDEPPSGQRIVNHVVLEDLEGWNFPGKGVQETVGAFAMGAALALEQLHPRAGR